MRNVFNYLALLGVVLSLCILSSFQSAAASEPTSEPLFPDFTLVGELTSQQSEALGAQGGIVTLSQIPAQYIFIEVYSLYCGPCQTEAPEVNALYSKIQDMGGESQLRFIGIGTGNTPYEVRVWQEKFEVPFPLFPDEEYVVHDGLGSVGTPFFVLLGKSSAGGLKVLHAQEGAPENMNDLLDVIVEHTGLVP